MLYHEKQVAALCGVHCINTLLQGPYVSEWDLAQIGHELDQLERQMLGEEEEGGAAAAAGGGGPASTNLDESGMFSIQVLTKALQVWGLAIIPVDSQELQAAGFDPQREEAFLCNLQEHWFSIRRCLGEWWNFNSLYPAPERLSAFHLTGYLDTLKAEGYTIFVVRGNLPTPSELEGPGKWWSPEEAQAAHKSAAATRASGRARNAVEGALARAAASGGTIALRSGRAKRRAGSDDEDADLAAAIAASMADQPGPSAAAPAAAAPGGHSYAAAVRHEAAAAAAGGWVGSEDGEDPELAAALAASLEDHHGSSQQQQQAQEQQLQQPGQQLQQQQQSPQPDVQVPEEPAEGSDGVLLVAFRLPSGGRLSRRFCGSDSVVGVAAYVAQQLCERGELGAGQRVVLCSQFPQRELGESGQERLSTAGVQDRDTLTVQLVG